MNFHKYLFSVVLLLSLCFPMQAYSIVAFPGAEGFGANSVGGRGGTVIKVTNTNDSGAGSLRAAVATAGARIIVFEVSGIINLESNLEITEPNVTIAGQTSPGGILVTGRTTIINADNVIIQHMRFRVGSHCQSQASPCDPDSLDALDIWGDYVNNNASGVIIDHCSISWGVDENFSVSLDARDITIQWSIISEGLQNAGHSKANHSKGILVSGKSISAPDIPNVSILHNYLAHNADRNPLVGAGNTGDIAIGYPLVDAVNNIVYNFYGALSMNSQKKAHVNWIHNYVKLGPDSNPAAPPTGAGNAWEAIHIIDGGPTEPMIYTLGNIGVVRTSQADPEWNAIGKDWSGNNLSVSFRQATRYTISAPTVTEKTMSTTVANCILTGIGATAPVRDSVDIRVLADFAAGTGALINNVTYPGDFPTFTTPAPPADTDNDGMADTWETANGLDVGTNDSAGVKHSEGYTNIERYLHYLSVKSYTLDTDCMPDNVSPGIPQSPSIL